MLLMLDVGNTQTVVGLSADDSDEGDVFHTWRLATARERTPDELYLVVQQLLGIRGLTLDTDVSGIAVSSGVPPLTAAIRGMADRYFDGPLVVLEAGVKTGLSVQVDNPREVGADRIANSVGALDKWGGPAIVVDFGTATTFDVVSANGEYLGGAIIPGVEISLDALFSRAAALSRVELVEPRGVIGRNTVEAIQSGVIYGYSGMIDTMCRRFEAEIGTSTIVATGGLASTLSPHSEMIQFEDRWLTLHGLRLIFEKNRD
jgi:type III pantothenate kinase